jgi:hypothetical protein
MDREDFQSWAEGYLADAETDGYRIARAGWEDGTASLDDEEDPIQEDRVRGMVRDTVLLVGLALAYYRMDGRDGAERFLRLQTYDPARSEGRYRLLFELGRYRRTQLMVEELRQVDLADLWDAVWFRHVVIWHYDGSSFAPGEHEELRGAVLADVRYDFTEEDVALEFSEFPGGLDVMFDGSP